MGTSCIWYNEKRLITFFYKLLISISLILNKYFLQMNDIETSLMNTIELKL